MESEEAGLLLSQARVFILRGRFEKAVEPLSSLLASEPKNTLAKSLLAICRAKGKWLPEAEKLAKEAISAEPTSAYAHLALAMLRAEQGRRDDASQEFDTALSISKDDAFLLLQHALFLKEVGRSAEALSDAEKAAALDPEMEPASKLAAELRGAMPKKAAEPLPEESEVHNGWFFAKMPMGWSYLFNEEKNVHFFHDESIPDASLSVIPLTGSADELAQLKGNFYNFVASDSGAKPSRMRERKMRLGNASEVHVLAEESGTKFRKIYVGYLYKDVFYILTASAPDESFLKCADKFEQFISSFLPKGVAPSDVRQEAPAKPAGVKELALHAGVGLLGALLLLVGLYFLALASFSGLLSGEKGAIVYLLVMLVGYVPLALLLFRLNPKLIYMLHLIYFLLLAACTIFGYLAVSRGTVMLFDKTSVLMGLPATLLGGFVLLIAAASLLIFLMVLLYGRMKGKELAEAYHEAYSMLMAKYGKRQ